MRIPRIYTSQDLVLGTQTTLEETASRHLCQVLRYKAGQQLVLFNGKGGEYLGELMNTDKRSCRVSLIEFDPVDRESPLKIHLGLALSKGDRFDWALQKSTELGVSNIQPLVTERSELRLTQERLTKKMAHWERLILSSCEQCQRNIPPALQAPLTLNDWLSQQRQGPSFILQPGAKSDAFANATKNFEQVHLAIGPEGGFSEREIECALSKDFIGMPLGSRILRTETAPLAAISILQWLWGDLSL